MQQYGKFFICTILLLLSSALCYGQSNPSLSAADILPNLGNPADSTLNLRQEKDFGPQLFRDLRKTERFIEDPELSEWIQSQGARLARHAPNNYGQYLFAIAQNNDINAYAMPGGVIVINSGLILDSQNEDQLAAVIAHEIAHVAQRHTARMLTDRRSSPWITGLGLLAGAAVASKNPEAAQAIVTGTMAASMHQQLSYSRQAEAEADRIGLRMIAAAGLNPQGMPQFMERMDRSQNNIYGDITKYLSSHPLSIDRLSDTRSYANQLGQRQSSDSLEYQYAREKLRQLTDANNGQYTNAALAPYSQALRLAKSFRYTEVLQQLNAQPKHLPIALLMAEAFNATRQPAKSIQLLKPLQNRYPNSIALTLMLAEALAANQQYNLAWQTLARIRPNEMTSLIFFDTLQRIANQANQRQAALLASTERNIRLAAYASARSLLQQLQQQSLTPALALTVRNRLSDIQRYENIQQQLERF